MRTLAVEEGTHPTISLVGMTDPVAATKATGEEMMVVTITRKVTSRVAVAMEVKSNAIITKTKMNH